MIVKDVDTLNQMQADALKNAGAKVLLSNGASSEIFGESEINAEYEVKVLDKKKTSEGRNETTGNYDVEFQVDVNPDAVQIGEGETITLTDTLTNLSFDYTSVEVSPSDTGHSINRLNTSLIFTLKNNTHYTITYKTRVIGQGSVSWNNKAEVNGQIASQNGTATITSGGEGTYSVRNINVLKHETGDMTKGLAASFDIYEGRLKDKNGNDITPVDWQKVGSITTDDQTGEATISTVSGHSLRSYSHHKNGVEIFGENGGWGYYLLETAAPEGYKLSTTRYQFKISDIPDYSQGVFKYLNNDTVTVANAIAEKGSIEICKTVKVNGKTTTMTQADGSYVFGIYTDADATVPYKVNDQAVTVTLTIENGQDTTTAAARTVTNVPEGTYYIKEISGDNNLVALSSEIKSVTVEAGATSASSSVSFENTRTIEAELSVKKTISAAEASDTEKLALLGKVSFTVKDVTTGIGESEKTPDITVNFESLAAAEEGRTLRKTDGIRFGHTYQVTETVTDNDGTFRYTGASYTVTGAAAAVSSTAVTTTTGDIALTDTSANKDSKEVSFTNTYEKRPGGLEIHKTVKVNGETTTTTQADGSYVFGIYTDADATVPYKVNDQAVTVTLTIENGQDTTTVAARTVTNVPEGTYYIKEISGTNNLVTLNNEIKRVTVVAGATSTVSSVSFENNKTVEAELTIKKTIIATDANDVEKLELLKKVEFTVKDVTTGIEEAEKTPDIEVTFDTLIAAETGRTLNDSNGIKFGHTYQVTETVINNHKKYHFEKVNYITTGDTENSSTELIVTTENIALTDMSTNRVSKEAIFENYYEKVEKPEFKKKIKDTNDSTGEASGWQDSADYDIGDAVPFRLTAKLPKDVTSYKKYHITFTDQMETSLTFIEITGVTVNEAPVTGYEFKQNGDQKFTLTLRWAGEAGKKIADTSLNNAEVAVEFTAKLNSQAKLGSEGNVNGAKLSYSNNPSSDTDGDEDEEDTDWDYVIAFTYALNINKVDENGDALTGAEFKLEKKLADNTLKEIELTSAQNIFTGKGLDDGTYILTETKAPKDYTLIDPIEFTVTAEHNGTWSVTSKAYNTTLDGRTLVLGSLTGEKKTGELDLKADDAKAVLTGDVKNGKTDKPSFEKKIKDINDSTGEGTGWQDSADYDISDAVPFRLTAKLPKDVTEYKKYHITFTDQMENTLSFKEITSVTVGGTKVAAADYELTKTDAQNFTVTLRWAGEAGKKIEDTSLNGAEVAVEFTATLNENAKLGSEGNVNGAKLSYSNNPSSDTDGKEDEEDTPWDYVIVFTYKVDINKVDAEGDALSGAEFKLEKKLADGTLKELDLTVADNVFTGKGLDDGTYILTETKAPEGYKLIDPIEFEVTAGHAAGWNVSSEAFNAAALDGRANVLTDLTGDVTKGELELTVDKTAGALTGDIKNEEAKKPEFEKKIMDTNDSTGEKSDWQDSADYDIGDAVPYRLTATLADNVTDYKKYHITFHDEMQSSLTFDGITGVKVNGTDETDYSCYWHDHDFILTLSWEGKEGGKIADESLNGAKVEVFFKAILNKGAVLGKPGNVNAAYLEYSNNPNSVDDSDTDKTDWDQVIAFTYLVDVLKVKPDLTELSGAEFTLEKKIKGAGNITVPLDEEFSTDVRFCFRGLDDGEYILTETKVPAGYKAIDPIEFKVTADHEILWEDPGERHNILTTLTGDVTTGELTIPANPQTGHLTATIINEEAKKPTFEKKIMDTNDTTGVSSGWQDSADYDIGDAVPYKLTATLADNVTDYRTYKIVFHDKMEPGLTFNAVTDVQVNGVSTSAYTLDKTDAQNFTVTLTWGNGTDKIADEALNGAIVDVYFNAILNEHAVLGQPGNINEAYLEYSCNPNVADGSDTDETDHDLVIVFTYKVDINKVDKDGNALTGAAFQLEKKLAGGTTKLVDQNMEASTETLFSFVGLDDGDYIHTETNVPAGYKGIDPIEFTVTADHKIEWDVTENSTRHTVLTGLTGNIITGELTLAPTPTLSGLIGSVTNEEAKKPEFEKKIMDTNDSTGETSGWQDSADYDIGDAVPYRLTATLADNVTDYKTYNIIFHDTMENSLTFDAVSSVEVNGTPTTAYTLTKNGDHQFDLSLSWGNGTDKISDASLNSAEVVVYFTAILNENAILGSQGNVNEAYLEYSRNPSVADGSDTENTEKDFVIAFTYRVDVNKVDENGNALAGAEFKLEKEVAGGGTIAVALDSSSTDSFFSFRGLDDGNYILTETKAPDGYSIIEPVHFTVTADHNVLWTNESARNSVLTTLTGNTTTGDITFTADASAGTVVGDVENKKEEKPTFEKKIMDTNDSTGETSGWQDSADYDIGDVVPYRLTATLANNVTDYKTYHITFHDTMEPSLTFAGIQGVTVNGTETTAYTLNKISDQQFDLTLTWGDGTAKIADETLNKAQVVVYFGATLNQNAILGSQGNVNEAYLEYSSNPSVDDGSETENTENDFVIAFTYKVDVNKVDPDGNALEGAEFKLEKVLADGTKVTVALDTVASTASLFSFKGLDDGKYVLTETKAPDGYNPIDPIEFTVTADHEILWENYGARTSVLTSLTGETTTGEITLTANTAAGSLTGSVVNSTTSVEVLKVDIADQKELAGAKMQILDKDGNVVDEWTSTTEAHVVNGLTPGEVYTLHEVSAPEGYAVAKDTTFVLNEDGTIDTAQTTAKINAAGILVVEDGKTGAQIAVTKRLTVEENGETVEINAVDQTFYVQLFYDEECTEPASEITPVEFKNGSAQTVYFNVEYGRTYYVKEVSKDGTPIEVGEVNGTAFVANFPSGNEVRIEKTSEGLERVYFDNEFVEVPDNFYRNGEIEVTKKVLTSAGEAKDTKETFYVGFFDDPELTKLSEVVEYPILGLEMNGGSTTTNSTRIQVAPGQSYTIYVAEVDEDGNPVSKDASFAYTVTTDKDSVTITEESLKQSVTITNKEKPKASSTPTPMITPPASARTGDDTNYGMYLALLGLAAVMMATVVARRRREEKR